MKIVSLTQDVMGVPKRRIMISKQLQQFQDVKVVTPRKLLNILLPSYFYIREIFNGLDSNKKCNVLKE